MGVGIGDLFMPDKTLALHTERLEDALLLRARPIASHDHNGFLALRVLAWPHAGQRRSSKVNVVGFKNEHCLINVGVLCADRGKVAFAAP